MRNILLGNKINKTKLISNVDLHWNTRPNWIKTMWLYDWRRPRARDHEMISLKHRPRYITDLIPNAIANYLCWAKFSLQFWHFWWVSSLFQWLPAISKPVLSILLLVRRLYIRISLTTRENALVARASWGSPCCCTCWCFGDYLRSQRAARIGQRKITQCAHRELWERPVLPGVALRRNCYAAAQYARNRYDSPGWKRCPIVFSCDQAAFLDCNSSLNPPMAMKCCTKLEVP